MRLTKTLREASQRILVAGCSRITPVLPPLLIAIAAAGTIVSLGASGRQAPAAPPQPAAVSTITVPQGNGAPVITDGLFSPGEWDDAVRVSLGETVALHVKQFRGVVFIGVRGQGGLGPTELYLSGPEGPIWKLHVSFQLFENVLPETGAEPPARFGLTTGWYANELRRDEALGARLQSEGKNPIEVIRATSYPSDGIEFAIRRSKIPGQRWLMRLWASALLAGGQPGMLLYPPSAAERKTDGWLELRLD